jgi:glycosyl transferase/beta-hydroxylase protein BlmF
MDSPLISLLVPTRGRPDDFLAMAFSAAMTAELELEIVARLDADDEQLARYRAAAGVSWVTFIEGDRAPLSSLWNECAAVATGQILMQCADDIRFRTNSWDMRVHAAFRQYRWDMIAYVYGRDGIADQRMATHGFMHRRWYEALGYFTWPHFTSDYGDLWNHTIAERLGRLHYIEELYTEHLHPAVGKAPIDETHRERIERDKADKNHLRWEHAQGDLDAAVSVLAALLQDSSPTDQ